MVEQSSAPGDPGIAANVPPPPPPPLAPPPLLMPPPPPPPRRTGAVWKVLAVLFIVLFVISLFGNFLSFSRSLFTVGGKGSMAKNHNLEEVVLQPTNVDEKIAVLTVDGVISSGEMDRTGMSLQEFIKEELKQAQEDKDVKAVILKVDSPGGEVLASDEINKELRRFQDDSHKPVVVSMGDLAASGGYYISVPARWIVANELTITGSIGVIMHGYNYRLLMDKIGLSPHVFKSGAHKDMLSGEREPENKASPDEKRIDDEEDAMVQNLIDVAYGKFKSVVQSGRQAAAKANGTEGRALASDWTNYADGRILSGQQALDHGFVDELGDFDTAVKRAEKLASISAANLVEYRVPVDLGSALSRLLGGAPAPAPTFKIDLGLDLPKLKAGRPYYILPTMVAN